jgi:hypothetical protein
MTLPSDLVELAHHLKQESLFVVAQRPFSPMSIQLAKNTGFSRKIFKNSPYFESWYPKYWHPSTKLVHSNWLLCPHTSFGDVLDANKSLFRIQVTMTLPSDLVELAHHLKQESLFVVAQRSNIQKTFEDVRKYSDELFHQSWIDDKQTLLLKMMS